MGVGETGVGETGIPRTCDRSTGNTLKVGVFLISSIHEEHYTLMSKTCPCNKHQIFYGCIKYNFQMKNCVFSYFCSKN